MSARPALRARVVLRPRSLDEVFDLAVAYLRAHFRDLRGALTLAAALPLAAAAAFAALAELLGFEALGRVAAGTLGLVLAVAVLERHLTQLAGRHLFERTFRLREGWRAAVLPIHRWMPSALLLWGPFALLGMLEESPEVFVVGLSALLVPGGVLGLLGSRALHAAEVELLERLSGRALRRRALELSAMRQGRNMGFLLQSFLLRCLFVATALGATFTIFDFTLQFENTAVALGPIGAALGYALAGPFIALARLFDYVDARTRGEGWDLQVRFQDIAERERIERERRAA